MGGRGVHVSPQMHQENTIRHRRSLRIKAESAQEYLTTREEQRPTQNWQRSRRLWRLGGPAESRAGGGAITADPKEGGSWGAWCVEQQRRALAGEGALST